MAHLTTTIGVSSWAAVGATGNHRFPMWPVLGIYTHPGATMHQSQADPLSITVHLRVCGAYVTGHCIQRIWHSPYLHIKFEYPTAVHWDSSHMEHCYMVEKQKGMFSIMEHSGCGQVKDIRPSLASSILPTRLEHEPTSVSLMLCLYVLPFLQTSFACSKLAGRLRADW